MSNPLSAGSVDFGPDVTSSDRSIKVLLNSQDKVNFLCSGTEAVQEFLRAEAGWLGEWQGASLGYRGLACISLQVFSEIRNEHFSNVFGLLSQKARNLQAQYDVRRLEWGNNGHKGWICGWASL